MDDIDPQRKGGLARAEVLPPERRRDIAKAGAAARWSRKMVAATHEGTLVIGTTELPSAVLEDGRRVLTSRSVLIALGRPWKGTYKHTVRPNFIDAPNLDSFITQELLNALDPIEYVNLRGQVVLGFRAELLPLVCDTYLAAREADKLRGRQKDVAQRAEILVRSLSKVGIIALVDEATGYQKVRARDELQAILSAYIAPELLPWAKRFPDSFYEELHRVRGWRYAPGSSARNSYIGKLTNTLIYKQLPPGVLDELRQKNPVDPTSKRRRRAHHQLLTEDIGHPHLEKQIVVVTTLLSISDDWDDFCRHFARKFPPGSDDLFAPPPRACVQ
jgi:hypothetical protein